MPTKVTIESGTSLEPQYQKALKRIAKKVSMKHPRWKWRKGVQEIPEQPFSTNAEKQGKSEKPNGKVVG